MSAYSRNEEKNFFKDVLWIKMLMETIMKSLSIKLIILLFAFNDIACSTSQGFVQERKSELSKIQNDNVYSNSWDNYVYHYLKQGLDVTEIINFSNQLFTARSVFVADDDINFWDLCVIEGMSQKIGVDLTIDVVQKIMEKRRSFVFADSEEKNFWDLCIYESLMKKYDDNVINIANEIIIARRAIMMNK